MGCWEAEKKRYVAQDGESTKYVTYAEVDWKRLKRPYVCSRVGRPRIGLECKAPSRGMIGCKEKR